MTYVTPKFGLDLNLCSTYPYGRAQAPQQRPGRVRDVHLQPIDRPATPSRWDGRGRRTVQARLGDRVDPARRRHPARDLLPAPRRVRVVAGDLDGVLERPASGPHDRHRGP